jgi:4-aminobutyrate aminotransferase-like enzyme
MVSTIRMCPPLIVTEKDIDVVLKVLDDALTEDVA